MHDARDAAEASKVLAAHLGEVDELRAIDGVAYLADQPHRHQAGYAWAPVVGALGQHARRLGAPEEAREVTFELSNRSRANCRQRG